MNHDQELLVKFATNADRIIDAATKLGVAYVGYKSNNHWSGGLSALVALRLSNSPNLAAGIAGTTVLALLGLTNIVNQSQLTQYPGPPDFGRNM